MLFWGKSPTLTLLCIISQKVSILRGNNKNVYHFQAHALNFAQIPITIQLKPLTLRYVFMFHYKLTTRELTNKLMKIIQLCWFFKESLHYYKNLQATVYYRSLYEQQLFVIWSQFFLTVFARALIYNFNFGNQIKLFIKIQGEISSKINISFKRILVQDIKRNIILWKVIEIFAKTTNKQKNDINILIKWCKCFCY